METKGLYAFSAFVTLYRRAGNGVKWFIALNIPPFCLFAN